MKGSLGNLSVRLKVRAKVQSVVGGLSTNDTLLLAQNERMLQRTVNEFYRVCRRRKLDATKLEDMSEFITALERMSWK